MVYFQTKNLDLGKFLRALDWKVLKCFRAMWNILRTLGIFNDHLVHFVFIWYIFSGFGIAYQEKSGNPARKAYAKYHQSLKMAFMYLTCRIEGMQRRIEPVTVKFSGVQLRWVFKQRVCKLQLGKLDRVTR
jgi:hypothetical protein